MINLEQLLVNWTPPVISDRAGKLQQSQAGYRCFVPSLRPPVLSDKVQPVLEMTAVRLLTAAETASWHPARSVGTAAPWRDTAQEYRCAQQIQQQWRNKTLDLHALLALHRQLCDVELPLLRRLLAPGILRSGPGIMTNSAGDIVMIHPDPALLTALVTTVLDAQVDEQPVQAVLHAALAHQYFTMIHPFNDGNGRVARMVAELILLRSFPTIRALSLTAAFTEQRREYCLLQHQVMTRGNWEAWIIFFCRRLCAALPLTPFQE